MALLAGSDGDRKCMSRDRMAADGLLGTIFWPRKVAIDASDAGRYVGGVGRIFGVILVTAVAEHVGRSSRSRLLSVDFVTVRAGYSNLPMATGLPLKQGAGVAVPAQFVRAGDHHRLAGMVRSIGAMASLAGHASSHKLATVRVVARRMAGEALSRLLNLLQIDLKDGIKGGLGVGGAGPGQVLCLVTLTTLLWPFKDSFSRT